MKISIFADSKFITDGKGNYYSSSNMRKGMLYPIADQCERVYIVCRLKQGDLSRIPFEDMINHPHITFVGISFFKGILGALIYKKLIIKKAIYAIENSDVCVFRFGSSISCIAVPIAKKLKKPAIGHVVGEFDMEVRNNPKHIKVPGIRHLVASWILKQNIKAFQQCDCLCGVTLSIASKYAPPTQEVF